MRETGPKGAVLVEVADALRVAHVERLVLDEARWAALFASRALQRSSWFCKRFTREFSVSPEGSAGPLYYSSRAFGGGT